MKLSSGSSFNILLDRDSVVSSGVFLLKLVLFFCGEFIKFSSLSLSDILALLLRIDKDDLLENDAISSLSGLRLFLFGEMFSIAILKFSSLKAIGWTLRGVLVRILEGVVTLELTGVVLWGVESTEADLVKEKCCCFWTDFGCVLGEDLGVVGFTGNDLGLSTDFSCFLGEVLGVICFTGDGIMSLVDFGCF